MDVQNGKGPRRFENMSVIARIDDYAHRSYCGYNIPPSEFRVMDYRAMMYWYRILIANDEAEKREIEKEKRKAKK